MRKVSTENLCLVTVGQQYYDINIKGKGHPTFDWRRDNDKFLEGQSAGKHITHSHHRMMWRLVKALFLTVTAAREASSLTKTVTFTGFGLHRSSVIGSLA